MLGVWAAHKTQILIINQHPPSRRSAFTKYYLLILASRDNGEIQQEDVSEDSTIWTFSCTGGRVMIYFQQPLEGWEKIRREEET